MSVQGSSTVVAATSGDRQLIPRFRTEMMQRGSRQLRSQLGGMDAAVPIGPNAELLKDQAGRRVDCHVTICQRPWRFELDVGEAHAEGIGCAVRHNFDLRNAGQYHSIAEILRLDLRGLDRRVDRWLRTAYCRSGSAWCRGVPRNACSSDHQPSLALPPAIHWQCMTRPGVRH
jgi:hypothetical protein